MATRLIKDHHSLTRNLKLNSNYISNDGDDEGISISNGGIVTAGELVVDRNSTLTTTSAPIGLEIDFDQTAIVASGQSIDAIGLRLDMNCDNSLTHVGDMDQVGIDLDMVANDTGGYNQQTAININVSGGDTNSGIYMVTPDVDVGDDIKIASSASSADHFTVNVKGNGETILKTFDNGGALGHLTLEIDGNVSIEPAGNCTIEPTGGYVYLHDGSYNMFTFNVLEPELRIHDDADRNDYFSIATASGGVTTISTVQDAGTKIAHLNIEPQGHVEFDGCGVGFDQVVPTFDEDDTTVDFRLGNKQFLTFVDGNIADLNLFFPATSGNFVLVIKQDAITGGRTIAADGWLVFESAASPTAADTTTVQWAGGTEPTLTAATNAVDIVSFYWDATDGATICYGVISQDFK